MIGEKNEQNFKQFPYTSSQTDCIYAGENSIELECAQYDIVSLSYCTYILCVYHMYTHKFNIISIFQGQTSQADVLKTCLHSCSVRNIDLVNVTGLCDGSAAKKRLISMAMCQ